MELKILLPIFWFSLVGYPAVSAQSCGKTGFFVPHGKYDTNRRLLLSSLASNVSARGGFYNASIGQGSDRVYAVGMCSQGADPEVCSNCLNYSSNGVIEKCHNQTEGVAWTDRGILCMIRYSNRLFFGSLEMEPSTKLPNYGDIQSNLIEYYRNWEVLTRSMIDGATSTSSESKYYAAGTGRLTSSQFIYAVMQCTPLISLRECNICLSQSVTDYESCCHEKPGGIVYRPSCVFKWDLNPFFQVSSVGHRTNTTRRGIVVAIVVPAVIIFLVLLALAFLSWRRRKTNQAFGRQGSSIDITATNSLQFDFKTIEAATDQFSARNVIGQGGFGAVYKGTLPNGTEVAVKRLSKTSGQGEQEFKNEVLLVAKLQHRNLVRLLGFSVEGEEKILVYEFVPNKSLDYSLFDPVKRGQLDWRKRYNIIGGITRGILYLHQDSRLTVVHRDLKASNILLDADMNPKIADFGLARNFRMDQTEANTGRVVGTVGYMPPEYVANGQFSMKSDVYSFGVLTLEIIGGKKSSSFHRIDGSVRNLVTHVWRLWNNESLLELVDPVLGENYDKDEVTRCIHIGLLCVQENPADRPTMSTIFQMLTNTSIALSVPQPPGFFFRDRPTPVAEGLPPGQSTIMSFACSVDDASITSVNPR